MGCFSWYFHGYNEVNTEVSLLGDSLGSDYVTGLYYSGCVSYEGEYSMLDGSSLIVPLWSTNGILLDSDNGFKIYFTCGELIFLHF